MLRFVTEIYPEIYPVWFGLREPNRAIAAVENSIALLKSEGHLRNPLKQWLNLFPRWIIKSWRGYSVPTFYIFRTTGLMDSSRVTLEFGKFPAWGIKVLQKYPGFCRTCFCGRNIRIILLDPTRVYQYNNRYSWKRSIINVLLEYQLINLRRVSVWNSSQLLSVPSESEVSISICYQFRNKIVWI